MTTWQSKQSLLCTQLQIKINASISLDTCISQFDAFAHSFALLLFVLVICDPMAWFHFDGRCASSSKRQSSSTVSFHCQWERRACSTWPPISGPDTPLLRYCWAKVEDRHVGRDNVLKINMPKLELLYTQLLSWTSLGLGLPHSTKRPLWC